MAQIQNEIKEEELMLKEAEMDLKKYVSCSLTTESTAPRASLLLNLCLLYLLLYFLIASLISSLVSLILRLILSFIVSSLFNSPYLYILLICSLIVDLDF